jgi:hypothetical protein
VRHGLGFQNARGVRVGRRAWLGEDFTIQEIVRRVMDRIVRSEVCGEFTEPFVVGSAVDVGQSKHEHLPAAVVAHAHAE